jgi:hypothetical protein
MYKSIVILAAAFAAVEAGSFSPVLRRQLVELSCAESGEKDCGDLCIPLDYTCCPSGDGGCPTATSVCQLGDNGEYGCCPLGETCAGDGGSNTLPGGIIVSTETIEVPGETSVIVDPTYTVPEETETVTVPEYSYTDTVTASVTVTVPEETETVTVPEYTYTDTVSASPPAPTNGTGVQPPSPSVSLFPGAADKTTFSALNFLAVLLPFLFA